MLSLILVSSVFFVNCEKEEAPLTPQELVVGKWTITSSELLATVVPGDGSFLEFEACGTSCNGVDHKVSDTTTGTFSYSINEEGTILYITDGSSDGGSWNGEWDILELTEEDFRITGTTIFGSMKVEMSR